MKHPAIKYAEIVSSEHVGLLDLGGIVYLYIPMTKKELRKHNVINGCWRYRLYVASVD